MQAAHTWGRPPWLHRLRSQMADWSHKLTEVMALPDPLASVDPWLALVHAFPGWWKDILHKHPPCLQA
eukprot:787690-Prorocentrum_lima.AAC.1